MMADKMAPDAGVRTRQPVVKEVTVPLPPARAFALFTDKVGHWWPLASHSVGGREAADCLFEPHVGGSMVEVAHDGTRHVWGTVLAWEPPRRIALTWHPGRAPETAQHLEITFSGDAGSTRVRLVHSGWERLGDVGGDERLSYESGWNTVLDGYAAAAARPQTA